MKEASSISLVPLPVSEKGHLDLRSVSPSWPDFHGKETENKSQKGVSSLMLAITGPGLQNTWQTALTPHLDSLKMTVCAPRTI